MHMQRGGDELRPPALGYDLRGDVPDDQVRPGVSTERALAEAPRKAGGGFAVPAFVDE